MREKFSFLKRKDGAALLEFVFCFPILRCCLSVCHLKNDYCCKYNVFLMVMQNFIKFFLQNVLFLSVLAFLAA